MPFKSKSQARYLFATHPKMAEEWASKTPSIKKLPEHKNYSKGAVESAIKKYVKK